MNLIFSVFAHRLFRESCVYDRGNYVKDLSKLGRELNRTIIIDNSPASYLFQPQNAIPCSSWFDDKNDTLLKGMSLSIWTLEKMQFLRVVPDAYNCSGYFL